jgi:hypothetical protein
MCGVWVVSLQVRRLQRSGRGIQRLAVGSAAYTLCHLVQEFITELRDELQAVRPVATETVLVWHQSVNRTYTKMSV